MYSSSSKINLHLKVTAKRPDGYHELESIFLSLPTPADRITIAPSQNEVEITCTEPTLPVDSRNICAQAIDRFAKSALEKKNVVISKNWSIHIEKSIPVSAGLGGGSSNAAIILNHLNAEYNIFNSAELNTLAKTIGADVPFFLKPQAAIVKGIGEDITPIELPMEDLPLLIIAPCFPVSAKWCYQNLSASSNANNLSKVDSIINSFCNKDWQQLASLIENDLAQPVFAKFPMMNIICEEAKKHDIHGILMSGSGPTLFAICQDKSHAKQVQKNLQTTLPASFSYFTP